MVAEGISIPLAALAGLLSFISPCVLPLVPAYIGYLTSQATNTMSSALAMAGAGEEGKVTLVRSEVQPSRWVVFLHGVFFVLGFAAVFILLGIGVGALGQVARGFIRIREWVARIGGVLVIVLGLHTLGIIRIPFLYYDTRNQSPPKQELGYFGSSLMGITFAAGWSPCVGTILGAILTLGFDSGSVGRAIALLVAYTLGLGLPFLLTALLLDRATGSLRKIQKHMRTVEIVSGVLLIAIGVLIFTGSLQSYFARLAGGSSDLVFAIDDWLLSLMGGGQ